MLALSQAPFSLQVPWHLLASRDPSPLSCDLDYWGCHFLVLLHTSTTASAFNAGWLGKNVSHGASLHICRDRRVPLSWRFRALSSHCWSHQCHSCCLWITWGQGPRERGENPQRIALPLYCSSDKKKRRLLLGPFLSALSVQFWVWIGIDFRLSWSQRNQNWAAHCRISRTSSCVFLS